MTKVSVCNAIISHLAIVYPDLAHRQKAWHDERGSTLHNRAKMAYRLLYQMQEHTVASLEHAHDYFNVYD